MLPCLLTVRNGLRDSEDMKWLQVVLSLRIILQIFQKILSSCSSKNGRSTGQGEKSYDIRCSPELIMEKDHLNCLRLLEPFGPGNPQPVFHDPAVTILDARAVGRDSEHLQVTIRGRYANIKGIGFSLGSQLEDVQRQPKRNMVYTPTMNRFRGNVNWQVRVIDI